MTASVDVVIVTYRSEATIGLCLRALPAACTGLDARAVVVDNSSDDFTLESARDTIEALSGSMSIKLLARGSNSGLAVGANAGLAALARNGTEGKDSDDEWVLYCNPDAILPPGSVSALVEAAREWGGANPAGLIAPALVNLDGTPQPMVERTYRLGRALAGMFRLGGINRPKHAPLEGPPIGVEWTHGAVVLMPLSVVKKLGGWDENYFLYAEDMDLCVRARAAGYDVIVVPEVRVPHTSGASAMLSGGEPVRAADRVRGMGRFLRLHQGRAAASAFGLASLLTSAAAAGVARGRSNSEATEIQTAKCKAALRVILRSGGGPLR